MNRFNSRIAVALLAVFALGFLVEATAEASPQWRLRRWSSRPPIDPTIREVVSFKQNRAVRAARVNGRYSRR